MDSGDDSEFDFDDVDDLTDNDMDIVPNSGGIYILLVAHFC